jgi:hypothetical protein
VKPVPPEAETARLTGTPVHVASLAGPEIIGVALTVTVAAELVAEHPALFVTTQ